MEDLSDKTNEEIVELIRPLYDARKEKVKVIEDAVYREHLVKLYNELSEVKVK